MPGVAADETKMFQDLSNAEMDSLRLLCSGASVIDWSRLRLGGMREAEALVRSQGYLWSEPADRRRLESIQRKAVGYLRRHFEFPIPRPVEESPLTELLLMASGKGHRQLCACTILKVMHIIHHLEAHELLVMLPASDHQVFRLAEKKIYRVIGTMMSEDFAIIEFIGGRKHTESLYTKLLSKPETVAAKIYDKLRFRLVAREVPDLLPILQRLWRDLMPFNYIIPNQSKNTLFPVGAEVRASEIDGAKTEPQLLHHTDRDNRFTSPSYRVLHFVADMPFRVPESWLQHAPAAARELGRIVFAQAEFQLLDQEAESHNRVGEASHEAYKKRQKQAVMQRLKLGTPARGKS